MRSIKRSTLYEIPVILGSIRNRRESAKVARFVTRLLKEAYAVNTELLDLKELGLPMMEERLRFDDSPPAGVRAFSEKMQRADAIVIVTPEYNSGYPGVLKNALDYLKDEYKRKPFGIITVSSAGLGGVLCLSALRQVVLHLGGVPIPAILAVPNVAELFDSDGSPRDPNFERKARIYFDELLWFTDAIAERKKAERKKKDTASMAAKA